VDIRLPKFAKLTGLIAILILMSFGLFTLPNQVHADAGPTDTPAVTPTWPPTWTPEPTSEPQFDLPPPEQPTLAPDTFVETSPDNVGPSSILQSMSPTNLCLVGAVVIGAIIFMVMVVWGVIQRMQSN